MKKILILLSAFALAAASFVAGAQEAPQLPNDPAVRVGKLDNGLTYYIRHNDKKGLSSILPQMSALSKRLLTRTAWLISLSTCASMAPRISLERAS